MLYGVYQNKQQNILKTRLFKFPTYVPWQFSHKRRGFFSNKKTRDFVYIYVFWNRTKL